MKAPLWRILIWKSANSLNKLCFWIWGLAKGIKPCCIKHFRVCNTTGCFSDDYPFHKTAAYEYHPCPKHRGIKKYPIYECEPGDWESRFPSKELNRQEKLLELRESAIRLKESELRYHMWAADAEKEYKELSQGESR